MSGHFCGTLFTRIWVNSPRLYRSEDDLRSSVAHSSQEVVVSNSFVESCPRLYMGSSALFGLTQFDCNVLAERNVLAEMRI